MNPMLQNLKAQIRAREHQGIECWLLHHQFKFYAMDALTMVWVDREQHRALVEWSHILAMMALQSERYVKHDEGEYREAVDNVLDLVRSYVPAIIRGREIK
jgi:hypothetical protein